MQGMQPDREVGCGLKFSGTTRNNEFMTTNAALLLTILVAFGSSADAAMYRCTVSGKAVWQDRPCPGESSDNNRVVLKGAASASSAPASDPADAAASPRPTPAETEAQQRDAFLKNAERDNQRRRLEREIKQLNAESESLREEMDADMLRLKARKLSANNNLAGATYQDSISAEMQAVATAYDAKLSNNASKIDRAQKQLDDLNASE